MTLEISFFRTVAVNGQVALDPIAQTEGGSQSLALTSSPAAANATPQSAQVMSLTATEAARYEYYSATSSVTATSHYILAGERLWLEARVGFVVSARTA